jgi:ribosomal protein S18 acetylase RimI-like enzyme
MRRAVSASSDVVVAYYDDELVGFGRMISDCTYYGTIWDVAVHPDRQRAGIGTQILTSLLCRAKRRKLYMVGLFTASHNRAFYENLGFTFFDDVHAMTCLPRKHTRDESQH